MPLTAHQIEVRVDIMYHTLKGDVYLYLILNVMYTSVKLTYVERESIEICHYKCDICYFKCDICKNARAYLMSG